MNVPTYIHGHYNGKVIVPDEPVRFRKNQSVIIHEDFNKKHAPSDKDPEELTDEEMEKGLKELMELMADNPKISIEATRRVNLYEDERG